jgi:hypothetical protein
MRKGPLPGTLTLLPCLNFMQHLIDITSFRLLELLYSGSILLNCTNNFGSVFANHWDRRIYETKFPTHISFLFSIFYCITLTFPLMLKNFHLFMSIAMLSCYQSPVNWRNRNVEENFTNKVNYLSLLSPSRRGIYVATWKHRGLALSKKTKWQNSQSSLLHGNL